ncbi:MAG: hypothetical protein HPZ99_09360, partial [Oscillospiraceae bacterium]|nr:hypothetical protein [Oscillospiraceae bacterium]
SVIMIIIPDTSKLEITHLGADGCGFTYKGSKYTTEMAGKHQVYNAITAIEAAQIVKKHYPRLTDDILHKGIATAIVPSRCQIIRQKSPMVIIDGAHNPDGMKALSEFVATLPQYPKIMICGMSGDKDWQKSLSYISPYIDKAFCIDGFCPKTVFAPKLAECFKEAECVSLAQAYHRAYVCAGDTGLLIIGGSLYIPSALKKFSN